MHLTALRKSNLAYRFIDDFMVSFLKSDKEKRVPYVFKTIYNYAHILAKLGLL